MTRTDEQNPKGAAPPPGEHVEPRSPRSDTQSQTWGNTLADVLHRAISSWRAWWSLVLLVWGPVLVVGMLVFFAFFKFKPTIEFNEGLFTISPSRTNYHYFLLHPRGWQNTGIRVTDGQRLRITASGSVYIDLAGLVNHVLSRARLEQQGVPDTQLDEAATPLRWEWLGPEGSNSIRDPADPSRIASALESLAPYGILLGGIHVGIVFRSVATRTQRSLSDGKQKAWFLEMGSFISR